MKHVMHSMFERVSPSSKLTRPSKSPKTTIKIITSCIKNTELSFYRKKKFKNRKKVRKQREQEQSKHVTKLNFKTTNTEKNLRWIICLKWKSNSTNIN